ncbi:MAG: hypothetical protein ABIM50_07975 [Novosphingobium sp.]
MPDTLPPGFAALEGFADRFAVAGTANRAQLRGDTTPEERQAYYDVMKDLLAPALDLLDTRQLDALNSAEQRLMNMALSFAHIAMAIEVQGSDEAKHAKLRAHMKIVRSTADAVC